MMRNGTVFFLALLVAGCGVQRPLMRPSEIPAYEEKQRKKRERIEQEQREFEEKAAAQQATTLTEPTE